MPSSPHSASPLAVLLAIGTLAVGCAGDGKDTAATGLTTPSNPARWATAIPRHRRSVVSPSRRPST